MDIEQVRAYCLAKAATDESFPFDETSLVLKAGGKIFAILSLDAPHSINLKCDPERAIDLREEWPDAIQPGYHMNKKHWNTVLLGQISADLLRQLIDHSYQLIIESLPRKQRNQLGL